MVLKWAVCCAGTPASSASGCCKQLKKFRLPKTGPRSQAATSMPSRAKSYFALCIHRDLHTPFTVRALPLVGMLLSSVLSNWLWGAAAAQASHIDDELFFSPHPSCVCHDGSACHSMYCYLPGAK